MHSYLTYLQSEMEQRSRRNPRFSQRAFAKALTIDPGTLTRILKGERIPGKKLTEKMLECLALSPAEKAKFRRLVAEASGQKKYGGQAEDAAAESEEAALDEKRFHLIAEWYHLAILELTSVKGFRDDPRWIASQLKIGTVEAQLALQNLEKFGLLERKNGRLQKTGHTATTDKSITNSALRLRQRQILEKALVSLETDPIEQRSNTTMTMAIDPRKLPEAKKLIGEFNRRMCALLESGSPERVYELSVSLFPTQKKENP